MPYSEQDAMTALNSIEIVQRRTAILRGYEKGAPYFFLWGVIWIIGYTCSEFYSRYAGAIWLILNLIGVVAGLYLWRAGRTANKCLPGALRYIGTVASAALFVAAVYFILPPLQGRQLDAFPALLIAFIYTVAGIQHGARFAVAGVSLTVLTVVGYAIFDTHFALWMAGVGSTTLITTGFWLRGD